MIISNNQNSILFLKIRNEINNIIFYILFYFMFLLINITAIFLLKKNKLMKVEFAFY